MGPSINTQHLLYKTDHSDFENSYLTYDPEKSHPAPGKIKLPTSVVNQYAGYFCEPLELHPLLETGSSTNKEISQCSGKWCETCSVRLISLPSEIHRNNNPACNKKINPTKH